MNLSFWIFQPLVFLYVRVYYLVVLYKTTMFHLGGPHNKKSQLIQGLHVFKGLGVISFECD
jgi:hypothetical protein